MRIKFRDEVIRGRRRTWRDEKAGESLKRAPFMVLVTPQCLNENEANTIIVVVVVVVV